MRPFDPRLLRHARATRGFLALSTALGLIAAVAVIVQAAVLARLIAAVFLGGAGLPGMRDDLLVLLAAIGARAVVAWAQEAAAAGASARVKQQLRSRLVRHVLDLGPEFLAVRRTGDLAQLCTRGVDALDAYFSRYLPQVVLSCVVPPLVLLRMGVADPLSAAIVLVTIPLVPIFMVLVGWATQARMDHRWSALQRLSHHFLDVVDGLAVLRGYGRGKAQAASVRRVTGEYRRTTLSVLKVSFLSSLVLELTATLAVALVAVSVGLRLVSGAVGLETALLVLILAPEAYLPLRQLGANYHAAAEGMSAAGQVFELLDQPAPGSGRRAAPSVAVHGLDIVDVSAGYPGRPDAGPAHVNLRVAPGEVVAVVGPSGVGKSTLVAAILGFVGLSSGRVVVGDVPVMTAADRRRADAADDIGSVVDSTGPGATSDRSIVTNSAGSIVASDIESGVDRQAWREQIAWVSQRPGLVAGTVADNVRLGAPDATDADVADALAAAAADELDPSLVVGEDGAGLSAGQRQRVALARAVLRCRRGAGLVLLDEPTEHLDLGTEQRVVRTLRSLADDPVSPRCVLVVVHREAVAAVADRVIRLEHPALAAAGGSEASR